MEQIKFLNKVRNIVTLQDYRFNHNDISEEEFTEFVRSMLNTSYKINKNKIFLDIEPYVAIFIYEHFMCDRLPKFINDDLFDSYIFIYSHKFLCEYSLTNNVHKYENLLIPFAMSHEDIIAEVDIISSTMNTDRKVDTEVEYDLNDDDNMERIKIGNYGVHFEMDRSSRQYKAKMFFQGFKQISLTK